jgi:hypothetical protein
MYYPHEKAPSEGSFDLIQEPMYFIHGDVILDFLVFYVFLYHVANHGNNNLMVYTVYVSPNMKSKTKVTV